MRLQGKTAIVTGANSGMGMATVRALSDMGARVIMLCRSEKRGREALERLNSEKPRDLDLILCDLGDYDSINHIGHFLLTTSLLDLMGKGSRIVVVASGAHKTGKIHFDDINLHRGFNVIKAYSQSKLANVLFTRELARRVKDKGITVNCCHPGAVATNIGIDRETGFGKTVTGLLKPFFQTPEQGARTAVFLATDDSVADVSGEYFYKCKIAKSSKRSKDMELAKELFEFSSKLINNKA